MLQTLSQEAFIQFSKDSLDMQVAYRQVETPIWCALFEINTDGTYTIGEPIRNNHVTPETHLVSIINLN